MQPFHFEHAPIRYIICIIPPRVPPHFRPNTSGSSFKIQKMELSMATDLPLWTSDDCIKFVQQSMKTFRSKVSDDDMDRVISNLRSNHVTGSTLMKFSDEEWRELISVMGLRVHIREAFKKVIKAEEKAALSQLHRRGLPKPPAEQTEKLIMHPRITSFFRQRQCSRSTRWLSPAWCWSKYSPWKWWAVEQTESECKQYRATTGRSRRPSTFGGRLRSDWRNGLRKCMACENQLSEFSSLRKHLSSSRISWAGH